MSTLAQLKLQREKLEKDIAILEEQDRLASANVTSIGSVNRCTAFSVEVYPPYYTLDFYGESGVVHMHLNQLRTAIQWIEERFAKSIDENYEARRKTKAKKIPNADVVRAISKGRDHQ
jgi:hypothetical protein